MAVAASEVGSSSRSGLPSRALRFVRRTVFHVYARKWFLKRANSAADLDRRKTLLKKFAEISRSLTPPHTERELLVIADFILASAPEGPIVECGCFRGASSAKLSLVARMTGRELYICDSFEGLPSVTEHEASFRSSENQMMGFTKGQFAADVDQVRNNIERSGGDLSVCRFVPGYFCDSLPGLKVEPCAIFSDADLISSTRDVLKHLWPRLKPGGRFYTHDSNLPDLVKGIMDPEFWVTEIGEYPPILFGAGYGHGLGASSIGYCEKATVPAGQKNTAAVPALD